MDQLQLRRKGEVGLKLMEHKLYVFCLHYKVILCTNMLLNIFVFFKEAKGDSKKRGRPAAPAKVKESKNSSDEEQAPVVKRGRGRPKGSKKKAAAPKAKVSDNN